MTRCRFAGWCGISECSSLADAVACRSLLFLTPMAMLVSQERGHFLRRLTIRHAGRKGLVASTGSLGMPLA